MALLTHPSEEQPASADAMDDRSTESFSRMYERYYPRIVAICRRRLPERTNEAEAIAQEAFLRAWASIDSYASGRPFWPWVSTIARRLCVDYVRESGRDARIQRRKREERPVPTEQPDEVLDIDEERRTVLRAFGELNPRYRRLISMRDIERWSYEEIAELEGVTVESVRSALRRGRELLRTAYTRLEGKLLGLPPVAAFARLRARSVDALSKVAGPSVRELLAGVAALTLALGAVHTSGGAGRSDASVAADEVGSASTTSTSGPTPAIAAATAAPIEDARVAEVERSAGRSDPVVALLPSTDDGSGVEDGSFRDVSAAPDGTVFANGNRGLFRSTDGGQTWQRRAGKGYLGGRLVFTPDYPRDRRIFAGEESWALQVSEDDGDTFTTLAPLSGPTTLSPDFSAGDSRLFVGTTPGWTYDVGKQEVGTLDLGVSVLGHNQMSFAFSPTYRSDAVMFVGAVNAPVGLDGVGMRPIVYRCVASACSEAVRFIPGGVPRVAVSPRFAEDGRVWAWTAWEAYRSSDGGRTFEKVALPRIGLIQQVVVTEDAAYVLRWGTFGRTRDEGVTWEPMGNGPVEQGGLRFALLPGGRMVVISSDGTRNALWWSADDGRTWHPAR